MISLLIAVHVLVSLLLIFIVLIQGGKGAEMGAAFGGGSSQTLFGGRGAATFLGKMTTVVAVVFMLTSLFLALASFRGASVIKPTAPVQERQAPGAGEPGGQLPPPGEALPLEQAPAKQ
jgi:preprotein translocase subunit SecG